MDIDTDNSNNEILVDNVSKIKVIDISDGEDTLNQDSIIEVSKVMSISP